MRHPAAAPALIETWQYAPRAPALPLGQLHLWRIDAQPQPAHEALIAQLPTEEQHRARQFRLAAHRRRYLLTQIALRRILSDYLAIDPVRLPFHRGPQGKPYLGGQHETLRFNLTTSDDLALLAVTRNQEIGIDCEQMRPRSQMASIAAKMFPPAECARIEHSPSEEERLWRFYRSWTRLEAQVKATGRGLYRDRSLSSAAACHTETFIPARGFVATLAAATPLPPAEHWITLLWAPHEEG